MKISYTAPQADIEDIEMEHIFAASGCEFGELCRECGVVIPTDTIGGPAVVKHYWKKHQVIYRH